MDQNKTGKFIAQLRKQHDFTQEALGEKVGVTNKTVSRWENGNYMPDIEMLQLLSKEFDVSINELLSGERLTENEFKKRPEDNIIAVSKTSVFSFAERCAYFKRKWRKEHISLFVILALIFIASVIVPMIIQKPWMIGFSGPIALIAYGYQNNRMMAYVESKLYD